MKRYAPIILIAGLLLVATGMFIPIVTSDIASMTFRWIYAAGALLTLLARALQSAPDKELPLRVRRLFRIESWSAVMYCVAAGFTFYDQTQIRDWVAFTLAGAALQVYSGIAISIALRKLGR